MTTWVLLRGLMRETRHWGDFPQRMQDAFPDTDIVALDFAGNGVHHALRSAASVAGMVAFCRAQLQERGFAPPYRVLALSLGAMAAVEWSARHPEEIACGVLVNTSMRPFSRFYRRLRWQNYGAILQLILLGGARRRERLILRLTSRDWQLRSALLDDWLDWQRESPVSRRNALRQLLAAARYRAPIFAPAPPLLVLAGENDKLVDSACSRALAAAWRCDIALHPTAGHDLPLDEGAWLAQEAARWSRDK